MTKYLKATPKLYLLTNMSVLFKANDNIVSIELSYKGNPSKKVWEIESENKDKAILLRDFVKKEYELFAQNRDRQTHCPLYSLKESDIDRLGLKKVIESD